MLVAPAGMRSKSLYPMTRSWEIKSKMFRILISNFLFKHFNFLKEKCKATGISWVRIPPHDYSFDYSPVHSTPIYHSLIMNRIENERWQKSTYNITNYFKTTCSRNNQILGVRPFEERTLWIFQMSSNEACQKWKATRFKFSHKIGFTTLIRSQFSSLEL